MANKKKVWVEVDLGEIDLELPFDTIRGILTKAEQDHPDHTNFCVTSTDHYCPECGGSCRLQITAMRLETDAEYRKRVKKIRLQAQHLKKKLDDQLNKDLKEYERLKKKFGGK